jgi:hypothetical protein
MNQELLRQSALELEGILRHYAIVDEEAARFFSALQSRLTDAQSGQILAPLKWRQLPGMLYFEEGSLRKYSDLEAAYAKFAVEATGGETPVLRELRKQMKSGID